MGNLGSTDLKRLHRDWRRRTPARLALALDGVQGPFNAGGLIRTAAVYRAEYLWVVEGSTGPDNPKVGKTALGTERFLTVQTVPDAKAVKAQAAALGFRLIGVELADGARPLHEIDLRGDVCLMVGHEDRGLSRAGLEACDQLGFLPQLGRVGSLNVATAGSIAMYEWARQQWARDAPGPPAG